MSITSEMKCWQIWLILQLRQKPRLLSNTMPWRHAAGEENSWGILGHKAAPVKWHVCHLAIKGWTLCGGPRGLTGTRVGSFRQADFSKAYEKISRFPCCSVLLNERMGGRKSRSPGTLVLGPAGHSMGKPLSAFEIWFAICKMSSKYLLWLFWRDVMKRAWDHMLKVLCKPKRVPQRDYLCVGHG